MLEDEEATFPERDIHLERLCKLKLKQSQICHGTHTVPVCHFLFKSKNSLYNNYQEIKKKDSNYPRVKSTVITGF